MEFGLCHLFLSSVLASTLLPGGSEVILAYSAYVQLAPSSLLWGIATFGNTLGGISSWAIGWWLARRFPGRGLLRPEHEQAVFRVRRYGPPLLLLSWLPVVGDPLCLAAGWMSISLPASIVYIGIGKGLRYALLLSGFSLLL